MQVDIILTCRTSFDSEEQLAAFQSKAATSDWVRVTLINLGGDGESCSGGLNGFITLRPLVDDPMSVDTLGKIEGDC